MNAETKKIHIVGKGEAPLSTTALPDVAGLSRHFNAAIYATNLRIHKDSSSTF